MTAFAGSVLLERNINGIVFSIEEEAAINFRTACCVDPVSLNVVELYTKVSELLLEHRQIDSWPCLSEKFPRHVVEMRLAED